MKDFFFFFNDTATTEIYTLSLHDALPISELERRLRRRRRDRPPVPPAGRDRDAVLPDRRLRHPRGRRSEEHTSELQSRQYLVCRLLLEKKNNELFVALVVLRILLRYSKN